MLLYLIFSLIQWYKDMILKSMISVVNSLWIFFAILWNIGLLLVDQLPIFCWKHFFLFCSKRSSVRSRILTVVFHASSEITVTMLQNVEWRFDAFNSIDSILWTSKHSIFATASSWQAVDKWSAHGGYQRQN